MLVEEAGPGLSVEERKSAKVALLLCEVEGEVEGEVGLSLSWLRELGLEIPVAGAEVCVMVVGVVRLLLVLLLLVRPVASLPRLEAMMRGG